MSTTNTDFLPNTSGLNLGSPDQKWDIFGGTIVADQLIFPGIPINTGNARFLQGVHIDPTVPLTSQFLVFNGVDWIPGFQSFDSVSLLGRPLAANPPALNQVLSWDGAQWIPVNQSGGGGGGITLGYVITPFSVTPTFTPNPVGSCTFSITLASDITSSTFDTTALVAGMIFNFSIVQDGAGGHSFAWPAEAKGTQPVGGDPGMTTVQNFFWDGTNLNATGFPAVF